MDNNMLYGNENERQVKLSDLLWEIVYGWRLLIVGAVILAVALGGLKFVKEWRGTRTEEPEEVSEEDLMLVEEELTEDELLQLEDARDLWDQIEIQEKYAEESPRMHIDPYEHDIVVLQYYVDTNYTYNLMENYVPDYVSNIMGAYVYYVNNYGIRAELSKRMDMTEYYAGELISAGTGMGSMFTVTAMGVDADAANSMADALDDLITKYKPTLSAKIGEHDLILVDRYNSVLRNTSLATEQANVIAAIKSSKANLDAMVEAFTPNQQLVWKNEKNIMEEEKPLDKEPAGISIVSVLKYIILGGVAGVFLGCVWIAMRSLLTTRLRNSDDIQQMYGLRVFGSITETEKKKRFLSGIDKWLDSLRSKEKWTKEEQLDLILTNIKVTCRKEQIGKVFLTSSVHLQEADKAQITELMGELQKMGIQAQYGERITSNAASFERMTDIGQAVMVEKLGVSAYEAIGKEIGMCREQSVKTLGVVVI